jgi:hypothetical protein
MTKPIRISRSVKKCFVKLTPINHAALSLYAHQHKTTLTDAVNSILRDFFFQHFQVEDSNQLVTIIQKEVIHRKISVLDRLKSLVYGREKRRPRLHFKDIDIMESSES